MLTLLPCEEPADAPSVAALCFQIKIMGTKNNPGQFDCYSRAEPDEPMFILLGRDEHAPLLVEAWADRREKRGGTPAKVAEARKCAAAMRAYRQKLDAAEAANA